MKFEVLIGPEDGTVMDCPDKCRIGRRHEGNDLVLFWDHFASKSHAEIVSDGANSKIVDCMSRHGTNIEGRCHLRESEEELRPGEILVMGKTWLRFLG